VVEAAAALVGLLMRVFAGSANVGDPYCIQLAGTMAYQRKSSNGSRYVAQVRSDGRTRYYGTYESRSTAEAIEEEARQFRNRVGRLPDPDELIRYLETGVILRFR
jgi:hypothetical protein